MSYVVIPAYCPDRTLVSLVEQMWETGCRMIVVDDGSGEEYQSIFDEISDVSVILRHPENSGKGAAIKSALEYIEQKHSHRDVVGIMDADGQHLPEDMLKLLEAAQDESHTLVLGVRSVGHKMPPRSRIGNELTRSVFHLISGVRVSDTQTGLRAFGTEMIPEFLVIEGERYEYEMNVLITMAKKKVHIREIPIKTIYKDDDNSTSHFRTVRDSLRIYKDILKFTFSSFSSFVLDYLLFSGMLLLFPHTAVTILTANILARMISCFYNYSMNCRFVFGTQRKICTAMDYFALACGILVMNNVLLETFVQIVGLSVYLAKILTECSLFLISWFVQKKIIFSESKKVNSRLLTAGKKA